MPCLHIFNLFYLFVEILITVKISNAVWLLPWPTILNGNKIDDELHSKFYEATKI